MNTNELDAIDARFENIETQGIEYIHKSIIDSITAIPALVAEVRKLRAALEDAGKVVIGASKAHAHEIAKLEEYIRELGDKARKPTSPAAPSNCHTCGWRTKAMDCDIINWDDSPTCVEVSAWYDSQEIDNEFLPPRGATGCPGYALTP